jgi:hypothetical protein
VFYAFIYSSLAGGVYAVLLLLRHRLFKETFMRYWYMLGNLLVQHKMLYIPPGKAMPVLRYGIAIAIGTICYMLHEADLFFL